MDGVSIFLMRKLRLFKGDLSKIAQLFSGSYSHVFSCPSILEFPIFLLISFPLNS